ncbi:MAG TPA: TetR/AcrR family transcriptional regulator [Desulfobacterales bacterium]|nr:TetR/AcrR family transcriptional regulator [Desulfobacterales bacterium]
MTLKEKIIHESLKLFSLKGFLGTPIDEILKAANSSKGGFYNHFKSKEDLFYHVLDEARSIWRERNLDGLSRNGDPIANVEQFLKNFRDRYLKDSENFPGGCIFITLLVELKNQRPHLADEINKGFIGLKNMLKRHLNKAQETGKLQKDVDPEAITEMLFNNILGVTITYNADKSEANVDKAMNLTIDFIKKLKA